MKTQVEFGPKVHLSVAVRIQFHCGTGGVLGTTDGPVRACELPSLLQHLPVFPVSPPPRLGKEADLRTPVASMELCRCGSLSLVPWVLLSAGSAHELNSMFFLSSLSLKSIRS